MKPTTGGELNGIYTYPGGRVECRGCKLHYLIQEAFNIQWYQLSGGPAWIDQDRYDMDARPPANWNSSRSRPPYPKAPPNEEQRKMLQALLMERFQLRCRRETKDGPVYLLVKGKKELKLQDSKDKNQFPWSGGLGGGMITGDGLRGINESMPDLALRLSQYFEKPVLDRTGLTGSYDFRVEYRSDDARPDVISMILTTVQELGLKLEVSKGPVESIVIEHVEKPSAN